jgi:hypothetical protein
MTVIEPPRVRKAVPSLRDLNNIEDAQWRPLTRFELAVRGIVKWFKY